MSATGSGSGDERTDPAPMHPPVQARIRVREEGDLPACIELFRTSHRVAGYPRFLPHDLPRFVAGTGRLQAWVATWAEGDEDDADGERIVGQVVLHRTSSAPVMALATASTGLAEDRLAVVARLLVDRQVQRRGIGSLLLTAATAHAHALGRHPILDVLTDRPDASGLYLAHGWRPVGEVRVDVGFPDLLQELVFIGPPPPSEIS